MRLDEMNARDLLDVLRGYQDARAGLPINRFECDAWHEGWQLFTTERIKSVDGRRKSHVDGCHH